MAEDIGRDEMLSREYTRLRESTLRLVEAATYTVREHDGLHRLASAAAETLAVVSTEFGRPRA